MMDDSLLTQVPEHLLVVQPRFLKSIGQHSQPLFVQHPARQFRFFFPAGRKGILD
jgi:hypothetical protein